MRFGVNKSGILSFNPATFANQNRGSFVFDQRIVSETFLFEIVFGRFNALFVFAFYCRLNYASALLAGN